jgi:hypothetical protein
MRLFVLFCVVAAAGIAPAAGQTTPWGDPDLQGTWSNLTPIPLERPAPLANKPFFTKEEAAALEKAVDDREQPVAHRRTDVRGRVPRGKLRTRQHPVRRACTGEAVDLCV